MVHTSWVGDELAPIVLAVEQPQCIVNAWNDPTVS